MALLTRPYIRGKDDRLWVDISNRAWQGDEDFTPETVENMRRWMDFPGLVRNRFFAELNGEPVGIVDAIVDPDFPDKGFLDGPEVVPEFRRKGAGTALAQAAIESLRTAGLKSAENWSYESSPASGLLASLGFNIARRFSTMRRGLDSLPQGIGESPDVQIAMMGRTDDDFALLSGINNEAFKEHFNYCPMSPEEMKRWFDNEEQNGERLFASVARIAGKPAGMLIYSYSPQRNDQLKCRRGHLSSIGVLREFRGKGVAKALLIAGMEQLRREGMEEAQLRVDNTNVTGAMKLYERLGFTVARHRLTWLKDLTAR